MKKIAIEYPNGYNERRNIINSFLSDRVEYVNLNTSVVPECFLKGFHRLSFDTKMFKIRNNNFDLCHLFNSVSFEPRPWIASFETIMPRFNNTLGGHQGINPSYIHLADDPNILKALDAMASKYCKGLIALSECNRKMQQYFLSFYHEDYRKEIMKKTQVIPPKQDPFILDYSEKKLNINEELTFTFVGRSFFRKGGMEILRSFEDLRKRYPLKLNIISSLSIDNYATKETKEDVLTAHKIISNNSSWINFSKSLSNFQVLQIMNKTHVGLLPTWADTYGYSILEFQAHGCPVISTNVRALSEVNDASKGWLIDLPKNFLGEALYTSSDERDTCRELLTKGLSEVVDELYLDKEQIISKSNIGLRNIIENHSVKVHAEKLAKLYF